MLNLLLLLWYSYVELLLFSYAIQLQRNLDHQGKQLGQMDTQEVSYLFISTQTYKFLLLQLGQITTASLQGAVILNCCYSKILMLILAITYILLQGAPAIKKEQQAQGQLGGIFIANYGRLQGKTTSILFLAFLMQYMS